MSNSLRTLFVNELNRIFSDSEYEKEVSRSIRDKDVKVKDGMFVPIVRKYEKIKGLGSNHYGNVFGNWICVFKKPEPEYKNVNIKNGERSYGRDIKKDISKYVETLDGKKCGRYLCIGIEILGAVVNLEKNGKYAYNSSDGLTVQDLKIYCKWNNIKTRGFKEKLDYTKALMKV